VAGEETSGVLPGFGQSLDGASGDRDPPNREAGTLRLLP
jgi:hypothetical protein